MGNLLQHRGCPRPMGDDYCRRCEDGKFLWWAVTLRNGHRLTGASCNPCAGEVFLLENDDGDLSCALIAEIVAVEEIRKPTETDEAASPHELTSLRKEVGRLYGIIKDMERDQRSAA
jgi:uncharacterized Zn finger protein (UPF0148 family)